MAKAYDRVEWAFLEKVMFRMGFHERWVKLVRSVFRLFVLIFCMTEWS